MKIVIDIPDDKIAIEYGEVVSIGRNNDKELADYIFAGTPLPKGHGDLKDIETFKLTYGNDGAYFRYKDIILAPTIIEADKGDKE